MGRALVLIGAIVAVGTSGCGSVRLAGRRFSPVAAVTEMEHKAGADVREVMCLEVSEHRSYHCQVILASGMRHDVTVTLASNGRPVFRSGNATVETEPEATGPFHRVESGEQEATNGRRYEEKSRSLPNVVTTR